MAMYPTRYHRPADLDGRRAALHGVRGCDLSRGRTHPAADAQAASRPSVRSHRSLRSPGLAGIGVRDRIIAIGATTRHADVAASPVVRRLIPALSGLAGSIGDRHVRHRGTIGGSVANNDPAADYPAAVLGLGATVVTDRRRIPADDYFVALYETALAPGEIITRIEFPVPATAGYAKFRSPASRYAIAAVFISKSEAGVRVAVTGAGASGVFRPHDMERALSRTSAPQPSRPTRSTPACY